MIPDQNNQGEKFMKTKKINALVFGNQLKDFAKKIIKEMEDPNNYDNFGIKRFNDNYFQFKTNYSGAEICYEYIYDLCYEINEIFENNYFEKFAKVCKMAKDYLDKYLEDLCNKRDLYFEYSYEDWITMKKEEAEEEDRELSDKEINIDNFYENIDDLDYNYNYDTYKNIEETLYILTESGDELSLPDDRIYIY